MTNDFEIHNSNFEKSFHNSRIAFLIINDEILYLRNSDWSHKEWYENLNLPLENFDYIVRGYVKNNKIVYYKGNYIYDEKVLKTARETMNTIRKDTGNADAEVWVGINKGEPDLEWTPSLRID